MHYKSFNIRLELNDKQMTLASQHAGVARHAYNWGCKIILDLLEQNFLLHKQGLTPLSLPSAIDLHKKLVAEVKSVNDWYYDVSKYSSQQSLRDLSTAITNYFRKLKNGEIKKLKDAYIKKHSVPNGKINYDILNNIGKPKYKKKGQNDSFYLEGPNIKITGNYIKIPAFGSIKLSESLLINDKIKNVRISKKGEHWYIAFKIEVEDQPKIDKPKGTVGVDLGIKTLATLSDGTTFKGSRPFKALKRKLKIEQRKLSKKFNKGAKKQSNNYYKQQKKVNKLHQRIANIRKDELHKLTTYLSKNHTEIVIEDLNVSGMAKNHKLAAAVLDMGFFEYRRQLTYKCDWYGSTLTVVDRFYPSSKTCSNCGHIKHDLKLSDRTYKCSSCKLEIDRDLNAAINLDKKAVSYTASACGELYKPIGITDGDSVKQENNINV